MAESVLTRDQAAIIGLKIRECRLQQGLQQKDLVEGEFSKSYISLIESGRVLPSARVLEVITRRLNRTVEQIIGTTVPGLPPSGSNRDDFEGEIFTRWDMSLDEARVKLSQNDPEAARNILQQRIKSRQLSSDQLKHFHFLMGNAELQMQNYEEALDLYRQAAQISHSLTDNEMEARVNQKVGQLYYDQGKYMLAIEAYRKGLEFLSNSPVQDPRLKQQLNASLGNCYHHLGDQNLAISFYEEAMRVAEDTDDYPGMADNLARLSTAYREHNNLPMAKLFLNKSLALYEAVSDLKQSNDMRGMYGMLLVERGDYQQSEKHLKSALELSLRMGNHLGASTTAAHLAMLYNQLGQSDQAMSYANQAIEEANVSSNDVALGQALGQMANVYIKQGDAEKASDYFSKAIDTLTNTKAYDALGKIYYDYGQALSRLGRTEEALKAMDQAYQLQVGRLNK